MKDWVLNICAQYMGTYSVHPIKYAICSQNELFFGPFGYLAVIILPLHQVRSEIKDSSEILLSVFQHGRI